MTIGDWSSIISWVMLSMVKKMESKVVGRSRKQREVHIVYFVVVSYNFNYYGELSMVKKMESKVVGGSQKQRNVHIVDYIRFSFMLFVISYNFNYHSKLFVLGTYSWLYSFVSKYFIYYTHYILGQTFVMSSCNKRIVHYNIDIVIVNYKNLHIVYYSSSVYLYVVMTVDKLTSDCVLFGGIGDVTSFLVSEARSYRKREEKRGCLRREIKVKNVLVWVT